AAVLEQARDPRQRLQMKTGRILGRHQQKEQLRRIAVQRVKVDSARAAPEDAENLTDTSELAVRNGNPVPDCGGPQPLAFVQNPEQPIECHFRMPLAQGLSQLAQNISLAPAAQLRDDHLRTQDFGNLHSRSFPPRSGGAARRFRPPKPPGVKLCPSSLPRAESEAGFCDGLGFCGRAPEGVSRSPPSPASSNGSLRISTAEGDLTLRASIFSRCFLTWRWTFAASRSITE